MWLSKCCRCEIERILQQVGGALDYAHRRGVIHRDIKPGNVLLDAQGDCYLADFGPAKMPDASQSMQLTATGVGMGTPAYISPEVAQGEKADARSDIYSLGIVLYEMVTGRVPFEADTPMAVIFKHISDPLPLPSSIKADVSPAVEKVLLKALAKNPAERYGFAGEMAAAFRRALPRAKPDTLFPNKAASPSPPSKDDTPVPDTLHVPSPFRQTSQTREAAAPPAKSKSSLWWVFAVGAVLLLMVMTGIVIRGATSGRFFSPERTPTALSVEGKVNEIITATAQAIAKTQTETAAAAETETALIALTAAELEIERAAAQAQDQATAEALAAATETEATNALATALAAGVDATIAAQTTAARKATPVATQVKATNTTQTAKQATSTFTSAPPTSTPTPEPSATPTATPSPTTARASISGKLAFPLMQGNHFKVYVLKMQPTAPTDLYAGIGNARHPALSPDGQYLLVDSAGGEFGAITRYTSQGHQPTEVTCRAVTSESGRPTWSPDSEYLAFDGLNADPANPQVYIHKIDTPECNLVDKRFMVQGGVTIENSGLYPLWGRMIVFTFAAAPPG